MGQPLEPLLTRDEAAEILRATPRFMRRLIAERRIRFVYVGRTPHIPESAVAEYIKEHRAPHRRGLTRRQGRLMTARRRRFGQVRKLPSGNYQASFVGPTGNRQNAP